MNIVIQQKYARISTGLGFEIMDKFWKKDQAFREVLNKLCDEVGAKRNCYASLGTLITGLKPIGFPPKGWRMSRQQPGIMIPDKTKKLGKEWAKKLAEIKLPQTEDLAVELGFPPFFGPMFHGWCTNVGYVFRGGVFYLTYPAGLKLIHPHDPISFEEYEKAEKPEEPKS